MLSMPPALAHTATIKEIKRSSVEGMSKRSAGCTAKSGAVETCGNRRAVDVPKRKLVTPAALVCLAKARQSTMQGTSPNRNQRMKRWMWHEKEIRKVSTRDYNKKTRRFAHSSLSAVMVILSQDGLGITRAMSGNRGASLGSLVPLLSSAKEY